MIHRESDQLFIGPYAIDKNRNVRPVPYNKMPGRHTANARHLTHPSGMIYFMTMEEGMYEVEVTTLFHDQNVQPGTTGQQQDSDDTGYHSIGGERLPGSNPDSQSPENYRRFCPLERPGRFCVR